MDNKTITRKLRGIEPNREEKTSLRYSPRAVLPILFDVDQVGVDPADDEGPKRLDPDQAKARLDQLRGDKVELEVAKMRGELIPASEIGRQWEKLVAAFRARILVMPTALSHRIAGMGSAKEVEKELKKELRGALAELSQYEPNRTASQPSGEAGGSSSGS